MKTHINQIFTIVSFFSLSLTTTLAISWGMNGLMAEEKVTIAECMEKNNALISVKTLENSSQFEFKEKSKTLVSKINLKLNR